MIGSVVKPLILVQLYCSLQAVDVTRGLAVWGLHVNVLARGIASL